MKKASLRGASRIQEKKAPKAKNKRNINKQDVKKFFILSFNIIFICIFFYSMYYLWITIIKPAIEKPISEIQVVADSKEIENADIKKLIDNRVLGNSIFTMDSKGLLKDLSSLDWVSSVDIYRTYPDKLSISMTFQKPIARWGDEQLLSDSNNLYAKNNLIDYNYLPSLFAPSMSRNKILENFKMVSKLLQPINSPIKSFIFTDSGSLTVILDNGILLKFGKDNFMNKINNMSTIYQKNLSERKNDIEYIDLRYANGIAVKFKEPVEEKKI